MLVKIKCPWVSLGKVKSYFFVFLFQLSSFSYAK
jgi:hypothetical protein